MTTRAEEAMDGDLTREEQARQWWRPKPHWPADCPCEECSPNSWRNVHGRALEEEIEKLRARSPSPDSSADPGVLARFDEQTLRDLTLGRSDRVSPHDAQRLAAALRAYATFVRFVTDGISEYRKGDIPVAWLVEGLEEEAKKIGDPQPLAASPGSSAERADGGEFRRGAETVCRLLDSAAKCQGGAPDGDARAGALRDAAACFRSLIRSGGNLEKAADALSPSLAPRPEPETDYRDALVDHIRRDLRGVETPCRRCDGWGRRAYGSTATWRGGIGGQAITGDVCDWCWGSGDDAKRWPSHRLLAAPRPEMADPVREAARAYVAARDAWFAWINDKSTARDDAVTDRLADAHDEAMKALRSALSGDETPGKGGK